MGTGCLDPRRPDYGDGGMKTKLLNLNGKLFATYWFVPGLMCAAGAAAALLVVAYDRTGTPHGYETWRRWIDVNTAEGARELLSTIASSTITLAGVIFSITILALSFASSNYGPRLLRNFMRDRASQLVLGTFAATYLYCLLVLRTVGSEADGSDIPHTAIAGALGLGVVTIGVLIFFIHHVARAIQVSTLTAGVGHDLDALIEHFIAVGEKQPRGKESVSTAKLSGGVLVTSEIAGYVQALSHEELLEIADRLDGTVHLEIAPGDYISRGSLLLRLAGKDSVKASNAVGDARDAVVVGTQRTNEQDLEFPLDQLAEIAVRALSPGTNDPFTAIACINRLGGALSRLASVTWPEPLLRDERGSPRVFLVPTSMGRLLRRAFSQIIHCGGDNPAIVRQVMKMLHQVAACADSMHRRDIQAFAGEIHRGHRTGDEHVSAEIERFVAAIGKERVAVGGE